MVQVLESFHPVTVLTSNNIGFLVCFRRTINAELLPVPPSSFVLSLYIVEFGHNKFRRSKLGGATDARADICFC